LSRLLVNMATKGEINTAVMEHCPKTNMRSEPAALLAVCESMKLLPQSKINPDSQKPDHSGLYSKTTCGEFHRLLVATLLAYGHLLEKFGDIRKTGIDAERLDGAVQLWLCTTLLWRIAYSHMLTQHLALLVKRRWIVLPTKNKENIKRYRSYTGFSHKFTSKRDPPTHDDDDESNEIADSTSLTIAFSRWICLQVCHSQACRIVTKFASYARAPVRFSLLAVKYPRPKPALSKVYEWQTTITELLSVDLRNPVPVTAAVALTSKSSYNAEDVVKALDEKIKNALSAERCNPIFHKFNPSPKNPILYSGNIHCEAALASLIIITLLRLDDTSLFEVLSHFRVHDNHQ
jgi:hypothetical protein